MNQTFLKRLRKTQPYNIYLVGMVDRKAGMAEADKYQANRWQAGHCHMDMRDQTDTDGLNRQIIKVKDWQYKNKRCLDILWQRY